MIATQETSEDISTGSVENIVLIELALVARLFQVKTYSTLHTRAAWSQVF